MTLPWLFCSSHSISPCVISWGYQTACGFSSTLGYFMLCLCSCWPSSRNDFPLLSSLNILPLRNVSYSTSQNWPLLPWDHRYILWTFLSKHLEYLTCVPVWIPHGFVHWGQRPASFVHPGQSKESGSGGNGRKKGINRKTRNMNLFSLLPMWTLGESLWDGHLLSIFLNQNKRKQSWTQKEWRIPKVLFFSFKWPQNWQVRQGLSSSAAL